MDVDAMGIFLEHQGLSDEAIDDFFEHHGVKGQKWGVRRAARLNAKPSLGPGRSRVVRNNARIAGVAGFGTGVLAARLVMRNTGNTPLSLVIGTLAFAGGHRAAQNILESNGQIKAKDVLNKRG